MHVIAPGIHPSIHSYNVSSSLTLPSQEKQPRSHFWKSKAGPELVSLLFPVNNDSSLNVTENKPWCRYHAGLHPVANSQYGAAVEAPPTSPYGPSEPQQPLQASTTLESNWAECVGINYPIIQHRHAINRAAAITRRESCHCNSTQQTPAFFFFFFASAEGGVDARTDTHTLEGLAHISYALDDRHPHHHHKCLISMMCFYHVSFMARFSN